MNAIAISNVAIRQFDNLYSLNDLHKASGGEARHNQLTGCNYSKLLNWLMKFPKTEIRLWKKINKLSK